MHIFWWLEANKKNCVKKLTQLLQIENFYYICTRICAASAHTYSLT